MAAAALVILTVLSGRHMSVFAVKDCAVLVTGPDDQWTAAQQLEWIPGATSIQQQLPGRPPGRSEVSFSVQTSSSGLEVRLFSSLHPGGYLLHVGPDGWRVQRAFVGAVHATLASGPPPPDHIATRDEWSSYAVSVTQPGHVQLQRLYDNGTRVVWLNMQDPEALPVDAVATRVVPPLAEPRMFGPGSGIGPDAVGDWGFWTFDCSRFYYQTADLCHLWPSWPSDVPLRFRTPNLRISPVVNVNVLIKTTGTAELLLYETEERYYIITLTPSELTLGRAELGVPGAREVKRACLLLDPAPPRFRLLWVSILRGIINIGLDEAQLCPEVTEAAEGADVADADRLPAPGVLAEEAPVTPGPAVSELPAAVGTDAGTGTPLTGAAEVTEITTEVAEEEEEMATTPSPGRTALVTWQDGIAYYVVSYGVRTPDGQGVWTVGCQPSSDFVADDEKKDGFSARGFFDSLKPNDSPKDSDSVDTGAGDGSSRRTCQSSHPFLLATVVLSVVSVVLLLVAVLLASVLISQRRRRSAELSDQRRLSLAPTDLFGAPPGGENEYAEVHLYDSIRPMSIQPGESSFKPLRRQSTPVLRGETKMEELPVFEERESSVEPLPPPPDRI